MTWRNQVINKLWFSNNVLGVRNCSGFSEHLFLKKYAWKKQMHILRNYWGKYWMKTNQILKSKGKNLFSFLFEHSLATLLASIFWGVFTLWLGCRLRCATLVSFKTDRTQVCVPTWHSAVFQNQLRSDSLLVLWRICTYSAVDGSQVHLYWAITLKHRGESMKINTVWVCQQPQAGKMFHFSAFQI